MKTGWVLLLTAGALALASVLAVGNAAGVTDPPFLPGSADPETYAHVSFVKDVLPIVQKHCLGCHGGPKPKADFSMDKLTTQDTVAKNRDAWEKVLINVRNGDMPPSSRKRPEQKEIDLLVGWLDATLTKIDTGGKRDPGRVTIRRLNRAEYRNTIRDLLGIDFKGVADFPSDDVGYGFDNIGDVLSLSPIHFEKYLAAARSITDELMKTPALRQKVFETEMAVKGRQARARSILGRFASRAYRRPASEAEINRLLQLVDLAERNGDSFDTGIQLALTAILVSPHFLFKIELDREPNNPDAVHPITEHELATRLSYFLWSSMPDEELFVLAAKGELRKNLQAQVRRMLKDPKAYALVENFAGQWLNLRNLRTAQPDPKLFPSFDESLRAAMQKETELYFHHVLAEDRNILEFLDSDYTFVNERLARHYGIPDVKGVEFRKVKHPSDARGGILTHGSILTLTSNPTRTSPVKRGVWILENILGTPPPVPPPDVPELSEDKAVAASAPLRVRLEQHRTNPNCAVCHQRFDPIGFALENFDAVGAWRTKDGKFDIDPSGEIFGGKTFRTPAEFRALLKGRDEQFRKCITEKLLTYGLGRGLERSDRVFVDEIARRVAQEGNTFSSLVIAIVESDPFQKRRGQAPPKKP